MCPFYVPGTGIAGELLCDNKRKCMLNFPLTVLPEIFRLGSSCHMAEEKKTPDWNACHYNNSEIIKLFPVQLAKRVESENNNAF